MRISSIEELASLLSVPSDDLVNLSHSVSQYYRRRVDPKSDGGKRVFFIPHGELKKVQSIIETKLLKRVPVHDMIHSYRKGRGTHSNAKLHIGNPFMVKLDIEKYFPSVSEEKVFKAFLTLGCSGVVARLLARLTTYKNQLPQGAPTSPAIANMTADLLAHRIAPLSEKLKLTPGIYGDDIHVSGLARAARVKKLLERIVGSEGFKVNLKPSKNKILGPNDRKLVTGYVVSEKLNVPKEEYKKVRAIVHNCLTKGPATQFQGDLKQARSSLKGKIDRIMQVNPSRGATLHKQFNCISWDSVNP